MDATLPQATALTAPRTRFRWMVLALIFLLYMLASADRANIGIVLPHIQAHFKLSNTEMGTVVSLFFIAYGLGQIPSAFLVKKFGVRAIMPLSMLLTSIMTASHGLVNSVIALKAVRIGLGMAEAPIANGSMTTINNWFPGHEKGTASGVFMAAAKCGPVIVPPLGAAIIVSMGWHWVFILFAIPGLLLPLVWLKFVPNDPKDSAHVSEEECALIRHSSSSNSTQTQAGARSEIKMLDWLIRAKPVKLLTSARETFGSWNVWGHALSYFLLVGTMNVILAWLPKYLGEVQGYSIMKVGFVASSPFVGAVLGNMAGGFVSDRLLDKRRKPLMMASCFATMVMMYVLQAGPENIVLLTALLFLTGFLLSVGFSLYGIFSSGLTTRETFPIATSVLNTCGQLGGATMPFLTGVILDHGSWDNVFLALSASSIAAFLLLLTIVEPRGEIVS